MYAIRSYYAPITAAVFPLVKKDGMPEKAREIEAALRKARYSTFYDEKAAIGRRYRRQDEIGTPFCITVDGDTLAEDVVTVRHRDSMEQERVAVAELRSYLDAAVAAGAVVTRDVAPFAIVGGVPAKVIGA